MISAGMLATMIYQLGGGRNGWSVGELIRRVQNMDFWQVWYTPACVARCLASTELSDRSSCEMSPTVVCPSTPSAARVV